MPDGFTPTETSWATTSHDNLPMPGGATLGEVPAVQFVLEGMGVPGVSSADARQQAAQKYFDYLAQVHQEAGEAAVQGYLAQFPPVLPEDDPPELNGLDPASAEVGSPNITMDVFGSDFTEESVIVFNGGDEVTQFHDDTHLSTGVKPSLVGAPVSVPVHVRTGEMVSSELMFDFLAPGEPPVSREKKERPPRTEKKQRKAKRKK